MRRPRPPRRIALAAAVAGAAAAAAAGCGREGELAGTATTTTPPRTQTAPTEPPTGTTPLTTTTPRRGGSGTRTSATTPREPSGTRTTATTPQGPAGTGTTTTARPPQAAASPNAAQLRRTAAEHARDRFRLPVTSKDVTLVRSRRKPNWAIASGTYGRTPWVVWLRDGKVALGTTDADRFDPIAVPCDVRPAFSEPGC